MENVGEKERRKIENFLAHEESEGKKKKEVLLVLSCH